MHKTIQETHSKNKNKIIDIFNVMSTCISTCDLGAKTYAMWMFSS